MAEPRTDRADYPWFLQITPRWRDNDMYGHVNNAVFYEYVDTAVNSWITEQAGLDVPGGPVVGLAVESGCSFFGPLAFPDPVAAGLRVARIGNSSVRYEVGLFRGDADLPAAEAFFVHVYVDRETRRPVKLPEEFRSALGAISVD
jgi:acyl-CoA thioester hydrolase